MNYYYHIYNRGAHKVPIFNDGIDYVRMLKLLYIANSTQPFNISRLPENLFNIDRKKTLVDIVAYCLMPNHIHIMVMSRPDLDIARFMHKLGTGYSSYFNKRYDHSGTIWQGPYKVKIGYDYDYFQILSDYIHLNPYGIITPEMTKGARAEHRQEAIEFSTRYEYSSLRDYLGFNRIQSSILSRPDLDINAASSVETSESPEVAY